MAACWMLPLADWPTQGMVCADSERAGGPGGGKRAGDAVPAGGVEAGACPAGGWVQRAELLLELGEAGGRRPQRAAYSVELAGTPPRAVDLRERGCGG